MLLFYLLLQFLIFNDLVTGRYGILVARSDNEIRSFCMHYPSKIAYTPETEYEAVFYPLLDLSPLDGCVPSELTADMHNKIVLFNNYTNSCSDREKCVNAENKGAAGVIIVPNNTKSSTWIGEKNELDNSSAIEINITLSLIEVETLQQLKGMGKNVSIKLYGPKIDMDRIDYSLIAIWVMAMFVVGIGSYWSGIIHYEYIQKLRAYRPRRRRTEQQPKNFCSKLCSKTLVASICVVSILVLLMSGLMLLLYYFYGYLVLFIIALFCIAATVAVFQTIDTLIRSLCKTPFMLPKIKIRKKVIKIAVYQIFLALLCAAYTLYWVFTRNEPYAWISQDILGIFFCINILRTLRLPSAMLCTLLLVLLFVYDIIFVFVTPYLTKSGESIMVHVATGGGGTEEQLPMLFKVPHLRYTKLYHVCEIQDYSLLGFGDILVPGFFIAYIHGFDMELHTNKIYFITGLASYGVGLVLTFVGIYMMKTAQPALLYLVPCTLIPVYVIALIRREVKALWHGNANLAQRTRVPTETPRSTATTPQTDNLSPVSSEENQLIR